MAHPFSQVSDPNPGSVLSEWTQGRAGKGGRGRGKGKGKKGKAPDVVAGAEAGGACKGKGKKREREVADAAVVDPAVVVDEGLGEIVGFVKKVRVDASQSMGTSKSVSSLLTQANLRRGFRKLICLKICTRS